jgi:hypothetical protein
VAGLPLRHRVLEVVSMQHHRHFLPVIVVQTAYA